jgi:hypothetical protein
MNHEQRYFDALKRITVYMTFEQLRRRSEKLYGLKYEEALEYAYENVIEEARRAIRGARRPKDSPPQRAANPVRHKTEAPTIKQI